MTSTLKVDQIQNSSGTDAIEISSTGVVTAEVKRTNIPYIQLLHNVNANYSAGATISNWEIRQSNRITHSGGVITVPEDGLYQVGISMIGASSGGLYLYLNNVKQFRISYGATGTSESWSVQSGDCILMLNANDNIKFVSENANNYYGHAGAETVSSFYCYMIG